MKKFCDIQSRNELADYLGIPRSKLTHILYVKKPDSYYTTFEIPKRNGDTRAICAPSGDLKVLQKKLSNILCLFQRNICNGVQREHNKKLNNGLPILHKVPPKRDYGRYFCIMAEKGGTSHGGLTEKLSLFFHAKKQEVNAYGR